MAGPELRLVDAGPIRLLLSLPDRTAEAEPRPVLVFLHGYDEAAPMDIHPALTRHGPLRPGNPPVAAAGFIVAAPQLPFGSRFPAHSHRFPRLGRKGCSERRKYGSANAGRRWSPSSPSVTRAVAIGTGIPRGWLRPGTAVQLLDEKLALLRPRLSVLPFAANPGQNGSHTAG